MSMLLTIKSKPNPDCDICGEEITGSIWVWKEEDSGKEYSTDYKCYLKAEEKRIYESAKRRNSYKKKR